MMGVGAATLEMGEGGPVIVLTDPEGNTARFPWCYHQDLAEDITATARLHHGMVAETREKTMYRDRTSIG